MRGNTQCPTDALQIPRVPTSLYTNKNMLSKRRGYSYRSSAERKKTVDSTGRRPCAAHAEREQDAHHILFDLPRKNPVVATRVGYRLSPPWNPSQIIFEASDRSLICEETLAEDLPPLQYRKHRYHWSTLTKSN